MLLSYIILGIILVASFSGYFCIPVGHWATDFLPGLITTIIGIFLTVFFVDRILKIKELEDTSKRRLLAFRQLKIPLTRHMHLLADMYKAVTQSENKELHNVADFFDDLYYNEIRYLDLSKKAPTIPEAMWIDHLIMNAQYLEECLENTLDRYSLYLTVDDIDVIETTAKSPILSYIKQLRKVYDLDREQGWKRNWNLFYNTSELLAEHINAFLKLVDSYNQILDCPIKLNRTLWRDDVAPKMGSGRLSTSKGDNEQANV